MRKILPIVTLTANEESMLSNQNTGFFANAQNDENKSCNTPSFKKELNRV